MGEIGVALFELAVLPLVGLFAWVRFLHQENPLRPGLKKASHGAGLVALCVLAYVAVNRAGSLENFTGPALAAYAGYIKLAWVLGIIIGLWLLRTGATISKEGFLDPVGVVGMALVKIGVGVAVYLLVWKATIAWVPRELVANIALYLYMTAPYGEWTVWAVIVWCVVTGCTKIAVVRMRQPPRLKTDAPPDSNLHGDSDFADPAEAAAAMKGQGNLSRMDKETF